MYGSLQSYASTDQNMEGDFAPGEMQMDFFKTMAEPERARTAEADVMALGGRGFTPRQQSAYEGRVRKRFKKQGLLSRLFGRFSG